MGRNVRVKVEVRADARESFGHGNTQWMPFFKFLKAFKSNDDRMYLSAQEVPVGPDGYPELCAPPVLQLLGDLPLQPQIMGSLVPQQINLWMGRTLQGSSSGLHHDYHDNLYVLLRGRKRFRLFPPQDARKLYTHGKVKTIHKNGRIVYFGQGAVNADGSGAPDVARWESSAAEDAVAAGQAAVDRGDKDGPARLAAAEERLEAALDATLSMDGFSDTSGSESAGDHEDRSPRSNTKGGTGNSHDPESFSQIDLSGMTDSEIRRRFPKFPGRSRAAEVELHAGEALYLPAGVFHEVQPSSRAQSRHLYFSYAQLAISARALVGIAGRVTSFSGRADGDTGGHLAVSWWFMPPDNLDASDPDQPYISGYWPAFWEARRPRLQALARRLGGSDHREANATASTPNSDSGHKSQQSASAQMSKRQETLWYQIPVKNSRRKHHHTLKGRFRRRNK